MEILYGTKLKETLNELSFQEDYPESTQCSKCGNVSIPLLAVDDVLGELIDCKPSPNIAWPHDSSSFVLYICSECAKIDVVWTQA